MSIQMMLLPLFVQVALTFGLGIWLAVLRVTMLRRGEVQPSEVALREPNWPPRALQVGNSYLSQFEMPVLFYVLTVVAIIARQADLVFVLLAWVFVALRLAHAYVHVTDNNLQRRGPLFGLGAVVLALMWLMFSIRLLVAA